MAPALRSRPIGTLAFGGVLGPEAPLIALGSIVGLAAARIVRHGPRESAVLSSAGSFSAISALFGGPLAAAEGSLIFVGLGSWGGLNAPGLVVPNLPPYNGTHLGELFAAIVVGVVGALVISAVRRAGIFVAGPGRLRIGMPALLLAGGLAVGVLAQVASALAAGTAAGMAAMTRMLLTPMLFARCSSALPTSMPFPPPCSWRRGLAGDRRHRRPDAGSGPRPQRVSERGGLPRRRSDGSGRPGDCAPSAGRAGQSRTPAR
jgi:hypothetical protein